MERFGRGCWRAKNPHAQRRIEVVKINRLGSGIQRAANISFPLGVTLAARCSVSDARQVYPWIRHRQHGASTRAQRQETG